MDLLPFQTTFRRNSLLRDFPSGDGRVFHSSLAEKVSFRKREKSGGNSVRSPVLLAAVAHGSLALSDDILTLAAAQGFPVRGGPRSDSSLVEEMLL